MPTMPNTKETFTNGEKQYDKNELIDEILNSDLKNDMKNNLIDFIKDPEDYQLKKKLLLKLLDTKLPYKNPFDPNIRS